LFVKIKHMAVRVAFAENGDKPENVTFKFIALAVGLNEAFTGDFGRGVKGGLDGERMIFRRRDDFRLAINRAGGTEGDAFDAVGAHGFQHVEGGDGVLLEILVRMFESEPHVGIGGEVKDKIAPGHRLLQRREVKVVAMNEFEIRMAPRGRQKFILARGKIVPADNRFTAGQQAVNKIAANEPAAPVTKTFSMFGREV